MTELKAGLVWFVFVVVLAAYIARSALTPLPVDTLALPQYPCTPFCVAR